MTTQDIVQKLWNLCDILRDDGINYSDYVTELVLLLFIKMEHENKESGLLQTHKLPEYARWREFTSRSGLNLLNHYKSSLLNLSQSTDPLIAAKPAMTMGATPELFMQAAGVIEFTLAFALIWTPLVRRASAIILTAVFVSAIFEFGKIDAIGHSGIIAVLIAIAADDARVPATRRDVVLAPVYYASALMLFLGAYYLAHSTLYGAGYGIGAGMGGIPVI